jgi:hypothetical protein
VGGLLEQIRDEVGGHHPAQAASGGQGCVPVARRNVKNTLAGMELCGLAKELAVEWDQEDCEVAEVSQGPDLTLPLSD